MSPTKAPRRPVKVHLHDFKTDARRILPPGHPLLKILAKVPDAIDAAELDSRLPDWLILLES